MAPRLSAPAGRLRRGAALLGLCATASTLACASASGPMLPQRSGTPAPNLVRADTMNAVLGAVRDLPGLGLGEARVRLPGGTVNTRGSLRALVLPVSVGERMPAWSDTAIAYHLFGTAVGKKPHGASYALATSSQRLFLLDATVLPMLAAPQVPISVSRPSRLQGSGMRALATQVLSAWAGRINMGAYDNDGPDGQPLTEDDDGNLDFVVITVETDSTPTVVRLPMDFTVPVGRNGRLTRKVSEVYVMTLPASGPTATAAPGVSTMVLRAMGLQPAEMFSPGVGDTNVSTIARLRLGWLAGRPVLKSGTYIIPDGQAAIVPLVDVPSGRALWLLERVGNAVRTTRVTQAGDGHYVHLDARRLTVADRETILPLTQTEGPGGPRLRLTWDAPVRGDPRPVITVALTAKAVADDDLARGGSPGVLPQLRKPTVDRP